MAAHEALERIEAAQAWLGAELRAHLPPPATGSTPGCSIVLAEQGIGDTARAIALCAALPGPTLLVGHYDGTMAKRDMAHAACKAGAIAGYIEAPTPGGTRLSRERLLRVLSYDWTVYLFDAMCVATGSHYSSEGQFQALYNGYPYDTWRLNYVDMPWWEIARITTGYGISPADLVNAVPTELAPWPKKAEIPPGGSLAGLKAKSGSGSFLDAEISDSRPYVTIHAGAGGGGPNVKVTPRSVLDAVVVAVEAKGINVVQVGQSGEQHLKCYAHKFDLRLPVTCKLMRKAVAHIDNDSCLPYLAHGMGVKSAVFFGPTPFYVYGLPGNLNIPPTGLCPMRSCFGGGQWGPYENWWKRCRAGFKECASFPEPKAAAKLVSEWVEGLVCGT